MWAWCHLLGRSLLVNVPPNTTAAAHPGTAAWLRGTACRAGTLGVLAVALATAGVAGTGWLAAAARAGAAVAACSAALVWRTWARRRRVLRSTPWRKGEVVGTSTVALFGALRTTLEVTFSSGVTIPYRLDDPAGGRAVGELCRTRFVWVASCPAGTVIATPALTHAAFARPTRVRGR